MTPAPRRQFPAPPTQARALVLRAHPLPDSFNHALADAWIEGAREAGAAVQVVDVSALDFDLRLGAAYTADQPLEPGLQALKASIEEAAHVTVAFPVWWGSTPAQLKGLFDRLLLPGWAFQYGDNGLPIGGLTGRSARMLVTMDAPTVWDRLINRASARRQVATATLGFVGLKPVRQGVYASVGTRSDAQRARMLDRARAAGVQDGKALVRRYDAPSTEEAKSLSGLSSQGLSSPNPAA